MSEDRAIPCGGIQGNVLFSDTRDEHRCTHCGWDEECASCRARGSAFQHEGACVQHDRTKLVHNPKKMNAKTYAEQFTVPPPYVQRERGRQEAPNAPVMGGGSNMDDDKQSRTITVTMRTLILVAVWDAAVFVLGYLWGAS